MLFSEPKIPQFWNAVFGAFGAASFSALQRAENSSMRSPAFVETDALLSFSALQRAENSSIQMGGIWRLGDRVSVLFSEPKIPQWVYFKPSSCCVQVSVLFSEPKIPQLHLQDAYP